MNRKYFTIYKSTNQINNRYYIGAHTTGNPYDAYLGSGLAIKQAVKKYGKENFTKEILFCAFSESDMYHVEKQLVEDCLKDELAYNLTSGGHGGFKLINENRHLYPPPMSNPDTVRKNLESRQRRIKSDPSLREKLKQCSLQNLQKAVKANTGKKRPDHSALMKEKFQAGYFDSFIEETRRRNRERAGIFQVTSPEGELFTTDSIIQWCRQRGLTEVAVWNTHRTGRPVTKGKSKGWVCKKISKQ